MTYNHQYDNEMNTEEARTRYLMIFDQIVTPFLSDISEVIQMTNHKVHRSKENSQIPVFDNKELDSLKRLEYTICHANELGLKNLQNLSERLYKVRSEVIRHCHQLIENKLRQLHNEDTILSRKVSLENDSLKNMEENFYQMPMDQAVTVFTDTYASLKRGVSYDINEHVANALRKGTELNSEINVVKNNIETNSMERCKVRREISCLEKLHENLVRRTMFNTKELNNILEKHIPMNEVLAFSKRIVNIKCKTIGILLDQGPKDVMEQWIKLSAREMNLAVWILSEGKVLKERCLKNLHFRITLNDDVKPIDKSKLVKFANPVLIISGPAASGKTIICHQILYSYLTSPSQFFPDVSKFEIVVLINSTSVKNGSFVHYMKNGIFVKCMKLDDPFKCLKKMKVLFVVDFDCGFHEELSLAINELISNLGLNKLIISCRKFNVTHVQGLLKRINLVYNIAKLEPLTPTEVRSFALDCLSTIYPRSSGLETMAMNFSDSINYRSQYSLLYPMSLTYLLKIWKDNAVAIKTILTQSDLFITMYQACRKLVKSREQSFKMNDIKACQVSSIVFNHIEDEALAKAFTLSCNRGFVLRFDKPPLSYEPIYQFVVSFEHISNQEKCKKIYFVHHVVVEFLAAVAMDSRKNNNRPWNLVKRNILPRDIQTPLEKSSCGLLAQIYIFLAGLSVSSGKVQISWLELLTSLFRSAFGKDGPAYADWEVLLLETKSHPLMARCISKNIRKLITLKTSSISITANRTISNLISAGALDVKEVVLSGNEPSLRTIVRAVKTQPQIRIMCYGGPSHIDEVIVALSDATNVSDVQGTLGEKGCASIKYLGNVTYLDLTITSLSALESLADSLQSNNFLRSLSKISLELDFKIEAYDALPALRTGKAYFTLRLKGKHLERVGTAVRMLRQLNCYCNELIITNMEVPSLVSRDLRKAVHPTKVIINTVYQNV